MKPSLLDKILREVNPDLALRRLVRKSQFDAINSLGYSAAIGSRMRTHYAWDRSIPGDEDTVMGRYDRRHIRLESRDLYRNSEIAGAAVDRFPSYAVWLGIHPLPQTSSKEWNKEASQWWMQQYVPACDYRQRPGVDLIEFQKLTMSHRMLDGDLGYILRKNGQLQPIEASRVATPQDKMSDKTIIDGVQMSKKGTLLGFWVGNRINGTSVDTSKGKMYFVKKESMIWCMRPGRIDQVRGVPDLARVVNKLRDYDSTDQFVLNKIKHDSQILLKKTIKGGMDNDMPRGGYEKTTADGKDPIKVEKTEWGGVWTGDIGEDIETTDSKTPNSRYVQYMELELRAIAAAIGLTYEYLMLIFTAGSFSAQRAAMLHAQHAFREWHQWEVKCFLQRLWNWRIAKAMKDHVIPKAPLDKNGVSEWWHVDWSVPWLGWVDPDKQAKADQQEIKMGIKSTQNAIRSRGGDRDDIFDEQAEDILAAKARAKMINDEAEDDDPVSWRDIADTGVAPRGGGPTI